MKYMLTCLLLFSTLNSVASTDPTIIHCAGGIFVSRGQQLIDIQLNTSTMQYTVIDQFLPDRAWPNVFQYDGVFENSTEVTLFYQSVPIAKMSPALSQGSLRTFKYLGAERSIDLRCE